MTSSGPTYRLVREHAAVDVPVLDEHQQRVVDHREGPLLVLAGPGTGKTTTLVEAIVDRIENVDGVTPDNVLALTFSRKAAEQLRDRVTARLGRTMSTGLSSTFHSFAYGLVRRYAPAEIYAAPLRLLSAPEQDVVLRELLTDHPESVRWPESLTRALGTRGFAREVNAVLSRAREKGHDGLALRHLGEEHDLPELVAAGLFLEQYLDSLDFMGATDYADLIRRATIEAADHRAELRARYRYVFVDEYQDTDPGQVALLRQLAGDGGNLVVVGDPHQSIYGFRGAEVRGILDFPREFPRDDGAPADVVALRTTRRFGSRLLLASQRVASRLALPGSIPDEAKLAFLEPEAVAPTPGRVVVRTFDTDRAESEHLADLLRRAHLEDGIAWDDMAVLVRSGRSTIPSLRRALGAAGVPVEVASDEVPLVRDPAVLPLLDAVRAVVNLDNDDVDHVDHVHASRAESLLLSPLGGLDAGQLRRLARRLRTRAKEAAHESGESPPTSRDLVRSAVVVPGFLEGLEGPEVERAARPRLAARPGPHHARRGRVGRGGALAPLGRHGLARAAPALGRARRGSGPPRAPRPRLGLRALRDRRPGRGAARARQRGRAVRQPVRAADPGRHAGRARVARRRRPAADGPPLQGARVAPRRGGPRAAGGLARPAPPQHAAAGRPDRQRRGGAARPGARAPARGAPAVLRRVHACPRAPGRHRGGLARRRRRAAVPVPRRARRHRRRARGRPPAPPAVDGGPGGRAPAPSHRPGHPRPGATRRRHQAGAARR